MLRETVGLTVTVEPGEMKSEPVVLRLMLRVLSVAEKDIEPFWQVAPFGHITGIGVIEVELWTTELGLESLGLGMGYEGGRLEGTLGL